MIQKLFRIKNADSEGFDAEKGAVETSALIVSFKNLQEDSWARQAAAIVSESQDRRSYRFTRNVSDEERS